MWNFYFNIIIFNLNAVWSIHFLPYVFGASGIWILKQGESVDVRNRFQKTLCKKALIGDDIVNTLKNNEKKGKTWKRKQKLKRKKIDGL